MFVGAKLSTITPTRITKDSTTTTTNKDIKKINVRPRPWALRYLNFTSKIVRSIDKNHMNVDLRPSEHQTSRQRYNKMENPMIGIATQGKIVTIIKNMDMFLRIGLKHIKRKLQ